MKALSIILVFLTVFFSPLALNAEERNRTVTQAVSDVELYFDPVYTANASMSSIISSLFMPLVNWSEDGVIAPEQAESWDVSEDGRVYTFHLRDEAVWSDGKPVIAEDFVVAFRRVVDPKTDDAPVLEYLIDDVVNAIEIRKGEMAPETLGVVALDDRTLQITLMSPTSYLPTILAQPTLAPIPSHLYKEMGDDWANQVPLVSNGPFQLSKMEPNDYLFTRNPYFYNPAEPDALRIIVRETGRDLLRAVASDEADIALSFPIKEAVELKDSSMNKDYSTVASPSTMYLVLNHANETFSDLRVRQALALIIDREALADAASGQDLVSIPAISFTEPSLFAFEKPKRPEWMDTPYSDRVAKAKALLAELGYNDDNPLHIEILARESSPRSNPFVYGIKSMMEQLPIVPEIKFVDRKQLLTQLTEKDYDVSLLTWIADYPDPMTFLALYRADAFANFAGWNNAEYQELLSAAQVEQDPEIRNALYLQMEELIVEEIPLIPVINSAFMVVYDQRIILPTVAFGMVQPRFIRFANE